jgi:hypothetical protein
MLSSFSTSRLLLSLLFSLVQASGGVVSVAILLLAHLGYHVRCSPLSQPPGSLFLYTVPSYSSQWWSRLCRHSPAGPPRLPCTMLSLRLPLSLYLVLCPLLFKPVVEWALSPFSCWLTSATMYDTLPLSTSRLPVSLLFSNPSCSSQWWRRSVAILLLTHLSYQI